MDQKVKILLVDDEVDYCTLLRMHLSFIGNFAVTCVNNGKDCLKMAKKIKPDIILLDVMMPGLDGLAVLESLKKDERTFSIPVIMLSALNDEIIKNKASQSYDEAYVTKPVDVCKLKEKIEEILKIRGGGKCSV